MLTRLGMAYASESRVDLGLHNLPGLKATGADLDGFGFAIHHGFDLNEVGLEQSFGFDANVLASAAFLLGKTLAGHAVAGHSPFPAHFAFPGHSTPSSEDRAFSGNTLQ